MKKNRAFLWIRTNDYADGFGTLSLFLRIPTKVYLLKCSEKVADDNIEGYLEALEELINEAFLIINATHFELKIDETVCNFVEEKEECLKFISMLTKEF